MVETLATLTAALAAINGLMQIVRLIVPLFTRLRWGVNLYDVVDTLYEMSKDDALRSIIEASGGKAILSEMDTCEADAKQAAKQIDLSVSEARRILYETRIVIEAHKAQALREKERARKAS